MGQSDIKEKNDYLVIAASMEEGSQHPFAQAIYLLAKQKKLLDQVKKPNTLKQYSAQGVEAVIEDETWRLGNDVFVDIKQSTLPNKLSREIKEWRDNGYSVLYLSNQSSVKAIFCIMDPLRKGIESFLKQADELGIKHKIILSGDHQQSVTAVAKQLGINEAYGGLSPKDKLEWMRRSQRSQRHQKIMM